MNSYQIKQLSLIKYLNYLGFSSLKNNNNEHWFLSPFREEKTASFKVNIRFNSFIDFGTDYKGNIIDFVMFYKRCDFKQALQILSEYSFSFPQQLVSHVSTFAKEKENIQNYIILYQSKIENISLLYYLKNRNLNIDLCHKYLTEVHYQVNGKNYFAIGFNNDQGGIEVRNKYFKGCIGHKDIRVISNHSRNLVLLEGWSDFISIITLFPDIEFAYDYVILNSINLINRVNFFDSYNYVFLALDNDYSGTKLTNSLLTKYSHKVILLNSVYQNYVDVNEYLANKSSE